MQPVDGAVSMGVDFTAAEVNWIDSESRSLLAPVPLPASVWQLLSALGGVGLLRTGLRWGSAAAATA
jgi:hypothetical protein